MYSDVSHINSYQYTIVKINWPVGNKLCRYIAFVCNRSRVVRLLPGETAANRLQATIEREYPSARRQAELLPKLQMSLKTYFRGQRSAFDFEIEMSWASDFGRSILRQCMNIPAGKTISYGQLAERAGHPKAARAVGNIMARNRIPILIPCHRVISSNGSLGGYSAAGGTAMKKLLLNHEAAFADINPKNKRLI